LAAELPALAGTNFADDHSVVRSDDCPGYCSANFHSSANDPDSPALCHWTAVDPHYRRAANPAAANYVGVNSADDTSLLADHSAAVVEFVVVGPVVVAGLPVAVARPAAGHSNDSAPVRKSPS
jgi:hypothetical protein